MSFTTSDGREKDTVLFLPVELFLQYVAAILLKNGSSVQSNIMAV